ncbi:YqfQ family protein [Fredinandcohnia quinoae]|uniref:YqfQ family protein n=1 Tax=Fredinandcohnia quinoae TaxID=2918902 RepID=A0AAW5E4F8_9BACI|nr:YqfQ family protein [Fredinandcohnia sp. SECRCQ15]MCH1624957.1 YqfQ family protein [Fredinandcohnia sp. SECRCQ15]
MFLPRRPMPPMNHPSMFSHPFGGYPQQVMQPRRGLGGLIKRLLPGAGRTNPMQGMQGFQGFPGLQGFNGFQGSQGLQGLANPSTFQGITSSTLRSLANPANLSSIMGNVQKTLKMAETVVPMVQQYGPLVKNLPAMWKIYNELKSSNISDTEEVSDHSQLEISNETNEANSNNDSDHSEVKTKSGKSVPKLYI